MTPGLCWRNCVIIERFDFLILNLLAGSGFGLRGLGVRRSASSELRVYTWRVRET